MTNQIASTQTFEERMTARIKESIGDLITDEELGKIVNRGLEEVFFKEKHEQDSWGRPETQPALIHKIVKDCMLEKVNNAVSQWINSHPDEVREIVSKSINDGLGQLLIGAVSSHFSNAMMMFQQEITNRLRSP